jgi:large subunit ribosomal protein L21
MYAIVDIKSKQFKVREGDTLYVPHLQTDAGEEITFEDVLLTANGDDSGGVQVGAPHVEGASVSATVLDHVKGDKVTVFKKKRRKRYRVKRGHRQQYTQIRVEALNANGAAMTTETQQDEASIDDEDAAQDEPPAVEEEAGAEAQKT